MAEELPTDFDAIILGTGLPESVVSAALSRIGFKVLHIDRNNYYSGHWAAFSFDALQEWIEINTDPQHTEACGEIKKEVENENEEFLPIPPFANACSNIAVQSFFREKQRPEGDGTEEKPKDDGYNVNKSSSDTDETSQNLTCVNAPSDDPQSSVEQNDAGIRREQSVDDEENRAKDTKLNEATTDVINNESKCESELESSVAATESNWQKKKEKKSAELDTNSIFENLVEKSKKFNIDLAPKVLFSRGLLVESLISANIAHYAEFKVVDRILTCLNGKIEQVPCSRSDVFDSKIISMLEKRALMRFMTFCTSFRDKPDEYKEYEGKPFVEFLESRKLSNNLQKIVLHAIAGVPDNTSTVCGLEATQRFLHSLGRYGNTPYLWSLYGSGEIPQSFCRMSAVFGGIYCLRKNLKYLVYDKELNKYVAVITEDGKKLNTKWVVMEKSYAPQTIDLECEDAISRAILITDSSLKASPHGPITLLTLPSRNATASPIHVLELSSSSLACPKSLYVVHLTTRCSSIAVDDFREYVEQLFTTCNVVEDTNMEHRKPAILWALYFNRKCYRTRKPDQLPVNLKLTSLPSATLCFEDAMNEAKSIFTSICPHEEFLLAVPNPEDIIWDDLVNANSNEEANVEENASEQEEMKSSVVGNNEESNSHSVAPNTSEILENNEQKNDDKASAVI